MRKRGFLESWYPTGHGMVSVGKDLYFLHRTNIATGDPIVGSVVEFDIAPPFRNGKFEQAIAAVIVPKAVRS